MIDPHTTSPLVIRPATAADAATLARLRFAMRAERAVVIEPEADFLSQCTAWMSARLGGDGRWSCWVAAEGEALVGTLWLQTIEKLPSPTGGPRSHAYMSGVYVAPQHRNAGVGGRLLSAALAWCRAQGVDAVMLFPGARSRPFYARHGFATSGDVLALRTATST